MAGSTSNYSFPYPENSDPVDVAGDVQALADSVDSTLFTQLANKRDNQQAVNAQTGTTYTLVAADAAKTVTLSNASAVTVTVPNSVFAQGNSVSLLNKGAGTVTVAAGSGFTLNGTPLTLAQNAGGMVYFDSASTGWFVPFSAGAAKATVSSYTGSPTITTSGSKTIYKWTSTSGGTITFGQAGAIDILVVGGGGGGGAAGPYNGGAGGAGGFIEATLGVSAAAYNVTVGTGGGSGGAGGDSALRPQSGLGGLVAFGGGAGANGPAGGGSAYGGGGGSGGGSAGVATSGGSALYSGLQGNNGGFQSGQAGGGGGAGGAGSGMTAGAGRASSITGSAVTYSTGGSGSSTGAGAANTGNGGAYNGYSGGSGVVIIAVG